jgi:hypothetical protein
MALKIFVSLFFLSALNFAHSVEDEDKFTNPQTREKELSLLARELIFDERPMEEIEDDLSYKKFLEEVKKDEQKNQLFDSLVPMHSFMFSHRWSFLYFFTRPNYSENSLWIQNIDGIKEIPDFGFKIHIGFLPFSMKRIMESVDQSMKSWCFAHNISKPMIFKIANLQKRFYSHMLKHVNGSQFAKELVIYPFYDLLVESSLPKDFKNKKEKMGDLGKYYSNMYTALSFAYCIKQNFNEDIKNKKLTEQDFLPVKNDFFMEDFVHFRLGSLTYRPIFTKFLDSNLPKNAAETQEDDRDFPMIHFFFEPYGNASLRRFVDLLEALPYLEKIFLYKMCLRHKIKTFQIKKDMCEESLLIEKEFFSGALDEKASFKNFLIYFTEKSEDFE